SKITATGIQNFFGKAEVLFKVAGVSRPGQPPKDQSYILKEGERQDDIEVVKIDEKNGIITFRNHGQTQDVVLSSAGSGGGSLPPLPVNNPNGGIVSPPNNGENGQPPRVNRFGQRGG